MVHDMSPKLTPIRVLIDPLASLKRPEVSLKIQLKGHLSINQTHQKFTILAMADNNNDDQQRKSDALRYIRFYAYLHKLVDDEIGSLLDELEATGQMDNTIILRLSDHGELGLSHAMR